MPTIKDVTWNLEAAAIMCKAAGAGGAVLTTPNCCSSSSSSSSGVLFLAQVGFLHGVLSHKYTHFPGKHQVWSSWPEIPSWDHKCRVALLTSIIMKSVFLWFLFLVGLKPKIVFYTFISTSVSLYKYMRNKFYYKYSSLIPVFSDNYFDFLLSNHGSL